MDDATTSLLGQIRKLRRLNRAAYAILEEDKTMDIVSRFYAYDLKAAKEWHRQIIENDAKILELSRKLCE